LDVEALPEEIAVSIITIGELRAGVLVADTIQTRDRRLATLTAALELNPIPVDEAVAAEWGRLRVLLRESGRRMPVNDSWIAATALAHDIALVTQDDDFPEIEGLRVTRV
jgi:predicted nucleic acid-binding protein